MAKGFKKPSGMGGMGGGMMDQIRKMQVQMEQMQAELAEMTTTASAGGAVKVTMTGDQRCRGVEIDPEFLEDADAEMLQEMLLTAINSALDQSRKMAEEKMGPLTGGLSGLGL